MTLLLLARHGETDWNREGRWQGHTDTPLNERGREQARELAAKLGEVPLDATYASDLSRAHETARIVGEHKRMAVTTDGALREVDVGNWSGLTKLEIASRFPNAQTHDGESLEAFMARVVGAATKIATQHRGERVLIVSHGGFMRALRRHATGVSVPPLANCEVYRLRYEGDRFTVDD